MLIDHSNCVCSQCTEPAMVIIFEERPVRPEKGERLCLRKVDSRCWDHYTMALMALPSVTED
jgi:hypothetical protein